MTKIKPLHPRCSVLPCCTQKTSHSKEKSFKDIKPCFYILTGEGDAFLRCMVSRIGDEVMVLQKDGSIVFVNQATIENLGYSQKAILKKNAADFFKEKITIDQWQKKYFEELKKKKKPISYIIERILKGGKTQTVEIVAVYMPYQSAEYVLFVSRDITARLELQKQLAESEDRYRLLTEQAVDGIFTVDLEGRVLYVNNAAKQIVNVPSSPKKNHFINYIDKKSIAKVWKCFHKVKKGSSVIRCELNIVDKHRRIVPVEFTASPILKDGKLIQIMLIIRDISKRKQLEHLLTESEKTKVLQHFIEGTTYEIYHPLKGLLDHSKNLINKYENRPFEYIGFKEYKDIMRTLGNMRDQIQYCFDTTNRLLDINRRKIGLKIKLSHINTHIRDAIKMLQYQKEVLDIQFQLKLAVHLPPVAIDPIEASQMITNVLTNALQSIPSGGIVSLKTTRLKKSNMVQIECQDNGIGIPKENLPRVFEPFFTTKHRGLEKSSGLGLAIVHSIVKTYGGDISIASDLRHGTTVKIILPISQAPKNV